MGHWHLNSRDVQANKKIFVAMGGVATAATVRSERVTFPGVVVNLNLGAANAPPPTGGTIGSVVNHVGFIVKSVPDSVAKWKAAGVNVLPGNNGRLDQAYVETPDGLRMEILEDKNQAMPIRHEHVHFFVAEAEIPKMQAWYAKIFGAKASQAQQRTGRRHSGRAAALQQGRRRAGSDQGPHPRPHRLQRRRPAGLHQEA